MALDRQDLTLLIELIADARAREMLIEALSKDSPTTRMVMLTRLEMKLAGMKASTSLTGEEMHDRDERARHEAFTAHEQSE